MARNQNATLRLRRPVVGRATVTEDLNDQNYAALNAGNQLIASLGEALDIEVKIATFKGSDGVERKYVNNETIMEIAGVLEAGI